MRRHELSDREWQLIEAHTLGRPGKRGARGRDDRPFVTAVFYRVRTGVPWRDLPPRFGGWGTVARRLRRWAPAGVRQAVFLAVQEPDHGWVSTDPTSGKAHEAAAGQKKVRLRPKLPAVAGAALGPKPTR